MRVFFVVASIVFLGIRAYASPFTDGVEKKDAASKAVAPPLPAPVALSTLPPPPPLPALSPAGAGGVKQSQWSVVGKSGDLVSLVSGDKTLIVPDGSRIEGCVIKYPVLDCGDSSVKQIVIRRLLPTVSLLPAVQFKEGPR